MSGSVLVNGAGSGGPGCGADTDGGRLASSAPPVPFPALALAAAEAEIVEEISGGLMCEISDVFSCRRHLFSV